MRVSQIAKWNQFVRDGKFTAQSSKRQRIPKEQYIMNNPDKLARKGTQNTRQTN